jgi:tetratricopeptide (TPR) repeat protein
VVSPLVAERAMANLHRLLAQHEFDSMEEMQAFLNEVVAAGERIEVSPETDLERAQELVYDAYEEPHRRKRIRLVREALEISPDCADAYVLLAEEARSIDEARDYYAQGVEAGRRALGEDFDELVADGMFWGVHETRGYMRARHGLAVTLWGTGERRAAIEHFLEMMNLNPGDNQGMRYLLINWLLVEKDLDGAQLLIDRYPDDIMVSWRYSRALLLFLRHGSGRRANKALREAVEWNPFVILYLMGALPRPPQPAFMRLQDPTEAAAYLYEGGLEAWAGHTDALEWMVGRLEIDLPKIMEGFSGLAE